MFKTLFSVVIVLAMVGNAMSATWYNPGDYGEITGVTATASSTMNLRWVDSIVNGEGIATFGAYTHHIAPLAPGPSYVPAYMWISNNTDPSNEWVEFDLGAAYDLTEVLVWNYNERVVAGLLPTNWTHGRGVYNMDIQVAGTDHVFSAHSNVNLNEAGDGYPVFDTVALVADEIQYVKFDINSNLASLYPEISQSYVGLSEVMFYPEPATMMLLGLGAVGLLRRRRA